MSTKTLNIVEVLKDIPFLKAGTFIEMKKEDGYDSRHISIFTIPGSSYMLSEDELKASPEFFKLRDKI